MGTITIEQSHSSMAKVLCILAWAGLVTAAPYYHDRRAGSSVDAEQIVNTVMKSLDLNQVIAQAMKGLSGSGSSFTQLLKFLGAVLGRTAWEDMQEFLHQEEAGSACSQVTQVSVGPGVGLLVLTRLLLLVKCSLCSTLR